MMKVWFDHGQEILIDGPRADYERLSDCLRQVLTSGKDMEVPALSNGEVVASHLVLRRGEGPNRISFEEGKVVLSVAPKLEIYMLNCFTFPPDEELPRPVRYHHHFDPLSDDGTFVAKDSLAAVFSLEY